MRGFMDLSLQSFMPVNTWTPVENGPRWGDVDGSPLYISDGTPDGTFLNIDETHLRIVSGIKVLLAPLTTIGMVAFHAFSAIACFFERRDEPYDFTARLIDSGITIARVVASPLSLIALEFAALYGLFMPNDGRKLYSSIERFGFDLSPCFEDEINAADYAAENRDDLFTGLSSAWNVDMPILRDEADDDV
jgi:hypothetical protein